MSNKLGDILIELGALDQSSLARALKAQNELDEKLGEILIKLGMIKEDERMKALSELLDVPIAEKADYPTEPLFNSRISTNFLKKSKIIPLREGPESIALAMADPLDQYAVEAMSMLSGKPVEVYIGMEKEIETTLESLYGDGQSQIDNIVADVSDERLDGSEEDIERLKDLASEAPIVRLVNSLFTRAYEERASDIHIEPSETKLFVRYRVDGVLREVDSTPKRLAAAIVSRIKIMAHMNIAERRLAQDGRIRIRIRDQDIDMRVSTVPTLSGESVVLRLLEHNAVELDFDQLGFDKLTLDKFITSISERHGIMLVTGPTGSGKTTSLYAALKHLNSRERKIITVEDPVEYQLEGVTQIQVNSDIGLTFSNVLRSIVRQDPDIIMIGEMRDLETAEIAVQSALTGHLVLSTLHTNDAAGAITRMLDMGVEDYLLTSTVNGVLGQRLVRTLCRKCREPFQASDQLVERMKLQRFEETGNITLYKAKGCDQCGGSGFTGRIGIYEFLQISDEIRNLVLKRIDSTGLYRTAKEQGLVSMAEDGIKKAMAGITTIEEVLRVTRQY
ncbi:MAG: type II secretion system ATPase GspE [Gammaproteobacteria bacterium]|nr:type II secretion system ATPase GspE [Gammaproteobacteria bacterium]